MVFGQVVHEGDWDPCPSAVANLLKFAAHNSTVSVQFKKAPVDLRKADALTHPLLYMTGHDDFTLSDAEAAGLRNYLKAGGLLLADACCGRISLDMAFRREIGKVFPGKSLEKLSPDHPLYKCHYEVREVDYTPRVREDYGPFTSPELEGISVDGRLAVIYSKFDLGNGWEQFPHPYSYGLKYESALQIGTNALVYAATH